MVHISAHSNRTRRLLEPHHPPSTLTNMQQVEAGPSNATHNTHSNSVPEPPSAPSYPLPSTAFYSVEYPGYVKATSVPLAVQRLGGQDAIDATFKRPSGRTNSLLELHLRPGVPFAHPTAGEVVATNNILLKVVKRRRRQKEGQVVPEGEYVTEAVGVIPKTARFRSEFRWYLSLRRAE